MNRALFGSSPYKLDLLLDLAAEDFPTGLTVIDPDGTLAILAANNIPTTLTQNTFYFDAADYERPPGFNIFSGVGSPDEKDKLTSDVVAAYDVLFPEGRETLTRAMSVFLLGNIVRVLLDTPGTTMLGVLKMLTDAAYRRECVFDGAGRHRTRNAVVAANWDFISAWDEKQFTNYTVSLQTKIGKLLLSSSMQNILGQQHSTFSLDAGKIVIVNLNRAKIGDQNAYLLGSLLIARARGPVYINDLGFFASDHLASLLAHGGYTVAFEFLRELTPKLEQAVLGIGRKYIFDTTREDAERLAFYVGLDNPSNLLKMGEEYRTEDGYYRSPSPHAGKRLKAVQRRSRAANTRTRRQVEAQVRLFLAG